LKGYPSKGKRHFPAALPFITCTKVSLDIKAAIDYDVPVSDFIVDHLGLMAVFIRENY